MNRFAFRLGTVFLVCLLVVLFTVGAADASFTYTVRNGDTLYHIANKFGVTVSGIKSASGLQGNLIYVGQRLTIPGGTSSSEGTRYTVVKGDTLYLISQRFGVSVESIRNANDLRNNTIYPGQVLNIPGGSSRQSIAVSRDFSRSDLDLLARAVYAEARGETYEGQVAVAAVILNRLKHPDFPKTIRGIIYQPGAFSCVTDGQINMAPNATAYKAVQDAINGWDPTSGAIYYWNPDTATSKWVWSRPITVRIGSHVFAK